TQAETNVRAAQPSTRSAVENSNRRLLMHLARPPERSHRLRSRRIPIRCCALARRAESSEAACSGETALCNLGGRPTRVTACPQAKRRSPHHHIQGQRQIRFPAQRRSTLVRLFLPRLRSHARIG